MSLSTIDYKVILASSSKTRKKILEDYGILVKTIPHKVNEQLVKEKKNLKPKKLVKKLAMLKAKSVAENKMLKDHFVIGSDQILLCENKRIDKATNLEQAYANMLFLNDKEHMLLSSSYVYKNMQEIWSATKTAVIYMKKLTNLQIKDYITANTNIVLETVGGYKVENDVMKCIAIKSGNLEVVQGFPIRGFVTYLKTNIKKL